MDLMFTSISQPRRQKSEMALSTTRLCETSSWVEDLKRRDSTCSSPDSKGKEDYRGDSTITGIQAIASSRKRHHEGQVVLSKRHKVGDDKASAAAYDNTPAPQLHLEPIGREFQKLGSTVEFPIDLTG